MITHSRQKKCGGGLVNKIINSLPFEAHVPGYQYCGPGTKLEKRLARGDPGINQLDAACREHDIAYSQNRENVVARNEADKILAKKAWERVKAKDSSFGEKATAFAVANIMKVKSKLGMGIKMSKRRDVKKRGKGLKQQRRKKCRKSKKPNITLKKLITAASKSSVPSNKSLLVIRSALKGAKEAVKKAGGRRKINMPRVLPIPSAVGGAIPFLIPLFAALSATGALAGGAASVAKAVNSAKAAQNELKEAHRHNKTMEAIALGKGLYLKQYNKGYGLYLKPYAAGKGLKKKSLK